jgi:hypothetical protein
MRRLISSSALISRQTMQFPSSPNTLTLFLDFRSLFPRLLCFIRLLLFIQSCCLCELLRVFFLILRRLVVRVVVDSLIAFDAILVVVKQPFEKHQLWAHPARLLQRLWHPKTTRIQPSVLQLLIPSVSTASRLVGVACSLVQASYSP